MVFTSLYAVVLVVFACHFVGNILTGRVKRRFGNWEWPHHDGPPIPLAPKFLHFQHVACMIILGFTGMYIRFPFFENGRIAMRWLHYIAMIIVVINLIVRLWYAFRSPQRDWREFAVTKRDIVNAPRVIMYYAFIKPSKPHLDKYNIMQKLTYTSFAPLLIIQAITGFALITATIPLIGQSPRDLLVGWWLGVALGSTDLAGWWARTAHYIINWLFIILTTIHVYLSMTEDFPAFLNFFGMSALDREHADHGDHGDHGDSDDHGHEPAPAFVAADH